MIVDGHTHIRSAIIEQLDASEHLGSAEVVDKCIVLGSQGHNEPGRNESEDTTEQINRHLSQYVELYRQKMVGFAYINPLVDDVSAKGVRAFTEKLGLKGIVLYCSQLGFHPSHTLAMELYETAQDMRLPIFFHNNPVGQGGILDYGRPFLLDDVAIAFPKLKIIVGNMGFPFYDQTQCLLVKHENVFADLSVKPGHVWQIYNIVVSAYEQGVMDKLLFGSAFPAAKAKDCMESLLGFNKLLTGSNLPSVPRSVIQGVIERDTLKILGIEK
jgi:predicted TIM-barrel fold metal-dependent hydrolase